VSELMIAEGENVERAVRRFRKFVEREGILAEVRTRRQYEKPGERRRHKLAAAARKGRRLRSA
jgi:small subunit ribosomal protein S21